MDREIKRQSAWSTYKSSALEPDDDINLAKEAFTAGWDAAIDTVKEDIDIFIKEHR